MSTLSQSKRLTRRAFLKTSATTESAMMYDVMGYSMGWPHLLGSVVVVLVIAALVKYVFIR